VPRTLIVFSTVDGHTLKLCRRIRQLLEGRSHDVTLVAVEDALRMDCSPFDKVVVGASIRYGKHRPSLYAFVARNRELLGRTPSAFFSVSAVARKPGKDTPERTPYFGKFTSASGWSPRLAATFGGKIDYSKYSLVDRLMIQFIMAVTRGPTDRRVAVEFTDWGAVDAFAEQISRI
jgi:menaquinone-dependent protoporphyrinogen oxidase